MSTIYLNRGIIKTTNCCIEREDIVDKDIYERSKQIEQLRLKVLQAEQERLNGDKTYSIDEIRKRLWKRYAEKN